MNLYQLTQRYPQIRINAGQEEFHIEVRGADLHINIPDDVDGFYSLAKHELCHFLEVPLSRLFLPNLGMPPAAHNGRWKRHASPYRLRQALYREIRVNTLEALCRLTPRIRPRKGFFTIYWDQNYHRAFPHFNRKQFRDHLFEKYQAYRTGYGPTYFLDELERRLRLLQDSDEPRRR